MEPVGAGTLGLQAPTESVMGVGYHSTEYLLLPLFISPLLWILDLWCCDVSITS